MCAVHTELGSTAPTGWPPGYQVHVFTGENTVMLRRKIFYYYYYHYY